MPRSADCRRKPSFVIERVFEPDPARCAAALLALLEGGQKDTPAGPEFGRPSQPEHGAR